MAFCAVFLFLKFQLFTFNFQQQWLITSAPKPGPSSQVRAGAHNVRTRVDRKLDPGLRRDDSEGWEGAAMVSCNRLQ